jgi:hypothetical protein
VYGDGIDQDSNGRFHAPNLLGYAFVPCGVLGRSKVWRILQQQQEMPLRPVVVLVLLLY